MRHAKYLLILLATVASAAVVVTSQPGKYARDGVSYDSADACVAAAKDGLGADARTCTQINMIVVTGSCADVAKPEWPADKGELQSTQDPVDDTLWHFKERDYVAAPYPMCWTPGWVDLTYPERSAPMLPNVQEPF